MSCGLRQHLGRHSEGIFRGPRQKILDNHYEDIFRGLREYEDVILKTPHEQIN